jgi:hypothetical protein
MIPLKKFNKLFMLAFCITVHKSQGISLNEEYCIHEFSKMTKKLKYVSLSRSTKYENISLIIDEIKPKVCECGKTCEKIYYYRCNKCYYNEN